jgi:hypothetical protein
MKVSKKTLPVIGIAIAGVAFLIVALEEWVIDGRPLKYTWLSLAFMFFALAVSFAMGRKSGGGTGPPNALRAAEPGRGGQEER